MKTDKTGFTLIETAVVMAILAILFGLSVTNLSTFSQKTSIKARLTTLITDIKSQQAKAMLGDTGGDAASSNFGLYFESDKYVLFKGSTYSPSDPENFAVDLDSTLQFTNILFPDSSLVFAKGSGDVVGFADGLDSVALTDAEGSESRTIVVNRYGVITGVN